MDQLSFSIKHGKAILSVLDDLAALRIRIFRAFPYLYDGTLDYELSYLQTYTECQQSFLFCVYDGSKMVGATTCIPLVHETKEVQQPFLQSGMDTTNIMYYGESMLDVKYRGKGIGKLFFEERENYSKTLNSINTVCFCAVERPDNHPMKPDNYVPHDVFWTKMGFKKNEDIYCYFDWQDINENTPTSKKMVYWFKKITN